MGFMKNVLMNVHSPVVNDPSLPDIDVLSPSIGPSSVEFRFVRNVLLITAIVMKHYFRFFFELYIL